MTPEPQIEDYLTEDLLAKIRAFQSKQARHADELQGKPFKGIQRNYIFFQDGSWAWLYESELKFYVLSEVDSDIVRMMRTEELLSPREVEEWRLAYSSFHNTYSAWEEEKEIEEEEAEAIRLLMSRGYTVEKAEEGTP